MRPLIVLAAALSLTATACAAGAPAPAPIGGSPVVGETAQLSAVGGNTGSGTATRSFSGGTFTHTVRAELPDPPSGRFYEGWLVRTAPTLAFFSTGRMTKEGGAWVLTFTAAQDYPDHRDVVITVETEAKGLDGMPEDHVLEGTF